MDWKGRRKSNNIEDRRGGTGAYANSGLNKYREQRQTDEFWQRRSDVVSSLAHQAGIGSMDKAMQKDKAETDSKKYRYGRKKGK